MSISRSKNALLNIFSGYFAQVGILVLSIIGRKIFLNFLSIDYLGINGLYTNILTILSFAELGLDTAVLYSLYKPVSDGDKPMIFSLIGYFKKVYFILAAGVFAAGLMIIPFLRFIINSDLNETDLIFFYVLFLVNTVASYFVAHKVALLSAYQEQRYQKIVSLLSNLILQILHIIVLLIWRNYYIYIVSSVLTTLINNFVLSLICNRIHGDVLKKQQTVIFDKKPIVKRIYSTFAYKIGGVIINSTDNILISVLVNTAAVGLYSNYYALIGAISGFIAIITASLISGIGNLGANGNRKRQYEVFNMILVFFHFIGSVGLIGFTLLFNDVITIWLGEQYLFDTATVVIISLNFYITNAVTPVWMYREANGLFEEVKYLMLIRAFLNIVLSVLFGILWGVSGIFAATAASMLLSSVWYEPKILFRSVFGINVRNYWFRQLKYLILTAVSFVLSYLAVFSLTNGLFMTVVKALIISVISATVFFCFNLRSEELTTAKSLLFKRK